MAFQALYKDLGFFQLAVSIGNVGVQQSTSFTKA